MKPEQGRFLVRFGAALVVLYVLIVIPPSNTHVVVPFTERIVAVSAALLRVMGEPVVLAGTVIRSGSFAVDVKNGCNGLEAAAIFTAAVIAFPATIRQRAAGLAVGFAVIQILNLVRVVSLFWLGVHRPAVFELFHAAVWQTALILVAVGLFIYWSREIARARARPS